MKKEERQMWLKGQSEKAQFASELKELEKLPVFQKIIDGMIAKKVALLKIIDNSASTKDEIDSARTKRMTIQWFLESMATTIAEGDRAIEKIKEYEDFEREKENKGGGNVQ